MDWRAMPDSDILAIADPLMNNLMEGSTRRDYAQHVRDFTARAKAQITPERLEKVCADYQERWGTFRERTLMGIFRREGSVALVWKQSCSKTRDEYVAEMLLVHENGRNLVDHVMVF